MPISPITLQLYNTLSRAKVPFRPLRPQQASIYTCGPTVYARAHLGNLRSYIFPDVLKRLLRGLGYRVQHVINITDVGHLSSDADNGEDKLERAARLSSRSAWEIAEAYTQAFLDDLQRLRIDLPDTLPRATDHIAEQIALILRLEKKGYAYRNADGVYMDTAKLSEYGRLAQLDVAGLRSGARVAGEGKRNKTDFALWKFTPPGVQRQMEWDSPWGRGFPGWHIECSAMSMKYLGETFDLHTGGTDHIPVHHTNEIAQSEAATGQPFVRYWLHGAFLILDEAQRMGKSEGNSITLDTLSEAGFEALSFRYLALNCHYRQYLHFSWSALRAADTALMGLRETLWRCISEAPEGNPARSKQQPQAHTAEAAEACQALRHTLCDDLNTPRALALLWGHLRNAKHSPPTRVALAQEAESLLALNLFDFSRLEQRQAAAPAEISALADERLVARQAQDYPRADALRERILAAGYEVRDTPHGYTLQKT